MNPRRVVEAVASGLVLAGLLVFLFAAPLARATPPIGSGLTIEFDSSSNGVGGATAQNFVAIAAGDLDNDGWVDLATGFNSGTNEVQVWENDGTPFSGNWSGGTGSAVGDTGGQVNSVALGDLDRDGDLDLISGDSSTEIYIWRNDGTPFNGAWSTNYNIGDGVNDVYGVAVADFDGDGNLDIVSASLGATGSELVVWENPYTALDTNPFDQTWTAHDVAATASLHSVAVADLNRDGQVDIIAGDINEQVRIWSNDGSWGFVPRVTLTGDGNIDALSASDLNQDGYLDIVSGGPVESGGTYEVIIWENDADSPFGWSFTRHDLADTADDVNGLKAADYNNDGYPDLAAVTDTGAQYEVVAWSNDADTPFDWSFTQVNVGAETQYVRCITSADLDNDGDVDLATGRNSGNGDEVAAWRNDLPHRNAPFGSQNTISTAANSARSVYATDVDGDGDVDVLSASYEDDKIAWYENNGSQNFTAHTISTSADQATSVYATDLDGDGDVDVLSSSWFDDKIAWYENDGSESFTAHTISTAVDGVNSVYATDVDGDGDVDVLSSSSADESTYDKIVWYENNGSQSFSVHTISTDVGMPRSVYAIDVDGDGDVDVLSASTQDDKIAWYENDGSQNFTAHTISTTAERARSVYAIDVDGDGDVDVLSASWFGDEIAWYENDGNGSFTTHAVSTAITYAESVYAADVDGDVDILSVDSYRDTVFWHENDGNQSFSDHTISTSPDWPYSVYAIDVDRDGDVDVLSASTQDDKIAWYENQGGSAGLDVADTAPDEIIDGQEDDVFKVVFSHNGIAADRDLELNRWDIDVLQSNCTNPLTTAEANAIIDNLRVRLDDGDDTFETDGSDVLVADIGTLVLNGGVQQVSFTDDDSNVQVSGTGSKTYWLSTLLTGDASSQNPSSFCLRFDPDADALVEGKTPDFSVSQQDTSRTDANAGAVPTAVTLASFSATPQGNAILLAWETAIEIDNVGFNLYRSTSSDGPYVKLNDTLIPSQAPGSIWGTVYTWLDEDVEPGVTFYYKLEDIEVGGVRTFHGPVSVSVQGPTALSLASFAARGSGGLFVLLAAALIAGSAFAFRRRHK